MDPTFLDRFYGLAEDNEGRLVTINENKGGRVRKKNDGTRYIAIFPPPKEKIWKLVHMLKGEIPQGWGV